MVLFPPGAFFFCDRANRTHCNARRWRALLLRTSGKAEAEQQRG
jgi:hypothetical protein